LTGFGNEARQPKNGNLKGEGRRGVVPALVLRTAVTLRQKNTAVRSTSRVALRPGDSSRHPCQFALTGPPAFSILLDVFVNIPKG